MELFSGIKSDGMDAVARCKATLNHYGIAEWQVGWDGRMGIRSEFLDFYSSNSMQ